MPTLLMRCEGPMQSWGTRSRFPAMRDTGLEPSKSGVIGLLAAACGLKREQPLDALAPLKLGVRVDRQGQVRSDFHTVLNVVQADGTVPKRPKNTTVTRRDYLHDASFLVGLEGERKLLEQLHEKLQEPVWTLFLGRRSCPPSVPLWIPVGGVVDLPLVAALLSVPQHQRGPARVKLVLEADGPGPGLRVQNDQPDRGATFANRRFVPRYVYTCWGNVGEATCSRERGPLGGVPS